MSIVKSMGVLQGPAAEVPPRDSGLPTRPLGRCQRPSQQKIENPVQTRPLIVLESHGVLSVQTALKVGQPDGRKEVQTETRQKYGFEMPGDTRLAQQKIDNHEEKQKGSHRMGQQGRIVGQKR